MDDILIEPLGEHKRGVFCCGNSSIDNFLKIMHAEFTKLILCVFLLPVVQMRPCLSAFMR
jgi:hypothetical protein